MTTAAAPRTLPALALAIGVLAVSGASILVRAAQAPAAAIAFWRLLLTALILLPFSLWLHGGRVALSRSDVGACLGSGAFLALHFVSWISSLQYTTVAASVVLVSMHPVFVLAAERFLLAEPVPPRRAAGAVLALVGTAVLASGEVSAEGQALLGDLLALLGAACMAGYLLIGRSVRRRLPVLVYATLVYGVAAALILLGLVVAGIPVTGYPWRTYAVFAGLALLPTIFGHTVFNWVLAYLPAGVVSVAALGEPVGAALLAWLLLGERPGVQQLVGGVAILAGLVLAALPAAFTLAPPVPARPRSGPRSRDPS